MPKSRESLYLDLAIQALNLVKAWRDSDGNEGFPNDLREKIDALLIAYELRKHGTYAQQRESPLEAGLRINAKLQGKGK